MGNIDTVEGRPSFRPDDLFLIKTSVQSYIGEFKLFRNVASNRFYIRVEKGNKSADFSARCLLTHPNLLRTVGYGFGWKVGAREKIFNTAFSTI